MHAPVCTGMRLFSGMGQQVTTLVLGSRGDGRIECPSSGCSDRPMTPWRAMAVFQVECWSCSSVTSRRSPPLITDRRFGSTNIPAGWDMEHLWDLLCRQSWSYRPAVAQA